MFNVIINGCVFNGRLEDACRFLFESFKNNMRLCGDVYKNVFCNLLTNRIMDPSYKYDITLRICKELKNRGLEIDYELYCKVLRMCYKTYGRNGEQTIQRELEEYKRSLKEYQEGNKGKDGKEKTKRFGTAKDSSFCRNNGNGFKTINKEPSTTGFQRKQV